MPAFGTVSRRRLNTCHPDMVRLMEECIKVYDFSVIEGERDKETQNGYFDATPQRTKVRWPNSKHNKTPSHAVDIVPWPSQYEDEDKMFELGQLVVRTANRLDIPIIWGADWDMDGDYAEHNFKDLPHFELAED